MTDQSNTDEKSYRRQKFVQAFQEITGIESKMAGKKGDLSGIYARVEKIGWSKADFKFAKTLKAKGENAGDIVERMKRQIEIAEIMGVGVSSQMSFGEDREPLDESAYKAGFSKGMFREGSAVNPHDVSSDAGQKWQEGFNAGNAEVNRDLASQFENEDGEFTVIPGSGDGEAPFAEGDDE